jgi:hypothetical protein
MGKRSERDWRTEERLQAIIEYEKLDEEKRGEYLRRVGLHDATIALWKEEMVSAYESIKNGKKRSDPNKKRIKELEKELRRKDKALAETAALLALKKKAQEIWGDGEDAE